MRIKLSKHQRLISDFIKHGRVGKNYFLIGIPEGLGGPFASHRLAEAALEAFLKEADSYEVVDRVICKKKTPKNKSSKPKVKE